ncbi:hypothetical protein AB0M46_38740 [Dactylosporangium sp. NPDC051485]|uniref:hypothetical protein n=1 Tax=Dactylosporangium sp. NPDC051485 TaxID=3154846 RepID=UPI00341BF642
MDIGTSGVPFDAPPDMVEDASEPMYGGRLRHARDRAGGSLSDIGAARQSLPRAIRRDDAERQAQADMARDIRVSTVVMTHPDRRHQAEQLRRRHPDLDIQIVLDPQPYDRPAALRTAKLAWNTVLAGATHQLVL